MLFTINGFGINDFKATNCVKAQWKQATTNAKSFETRISKYILPWRDVRIVQRCVHIPSRLSMICHCKNVNFRYCFSKLLLNLCIVKNLLIKCGLKFPSAKVSGTVPYSACYPFGGTLFESGQQWTEVNIIYCCQQKSYWATAYTCATIWFFYHPIILNTEAILPKNGGIAE